MTIKRVRDERVEQVRSGLPICALPIDAHAEDIWTQAVSLHAERLNLGPGDVWLPFPDTCPRGQHCGVLVQGRASLVMDQEKRPTMTLAPKSLLPEGLAA